MLNSVHVVAAAAVVTVVPNPAISIPLAFFSHFALDTIPHWNWSPGKTTAGKLASINDGMIALIIALSLALYLERSWVVLAAGVASMIPDIIQAPYHFWDWKPNWLRTFINWERKRQKWPRMKPWMGIATQIVVVLIALIIIFLA